MHSNFLRWDRILGHSVFITLLVLAWQHTDLRTTSGDTAYQVFKWVNDQGLDIEAHRYTAVLPQLAVKLFKVFHAPLDTLLRVASLAHVGVAYVVWLICLLWIKAPRSALAVALAAVLCTRLTFYGPVLEANYLLCYPFLFFAVLEHAGGQGFNKLMWVAALLAAAVTLFVHPLGWLILLYGTVFLWAFGKLERRQALGLGLVLLAGAALVRVGCPPTAYEQAQYAGLREALSGKGLAGAWGSVDFLVGHTLRYTTSYLPALVLFILLVTGLAVLRHRRAAAVVLLGVLGFLGLVLVTFRAGDAAMMMDRAFLPVATLIALPASFLQDKLGRPWRMAALLCFFVVGFVKLRDVSFASRALGREMERRTVLIADLHHAGLDRVVIDQAGTDRYGIRPNWAFPWSMLLLSARDGADHALFVELSADTALEREQGLPVFSAPWNAHYFQPPQGRPKLWPEDAGHSH